MTQTAMPGRAGFRPSPRMGDRRAPLLLRRHGRPPDPGRARRSRPSPSGCRPRASAARAAWTRSARSVASRSSPAPASSWCGCARTARTQLLWRVRRKLIISYLFIGVVPAILIVTFFVLSGLLLFANLSSYLIRASLTDLADEAMSVARLAAVELESRDGAAAIRDVLERRAAAARRRIPRHLPGRGARRGRAVRTQPGRAAARSSGRPPVDCGRVDRMGPAPVFLPAWVPCDGFAGVLASSVAPAGGTQPASRARRPPTCSCGRSCSPIGVPGRGASWSTCRSPARSRPGSRRRRGSRWAAPASSPGRPCPCRPGGRPGRRCRGRRLASERSWRFPGWPCWTTSTGSPGKTEPLPVNIGLSVPAIYQRLSASQASLGGTRSFGDLLLVAAAVRQRPVPHHRGRRAGHGAGPGALDHGRGPRAVRRHRARAAGRLRAPHPGARQRPARRAGQLVQPDDGQHRGPPAPGRREEASRGRDAPGPRDPDVAAAARAAAGARPHDQRALRAGQGGGRRLLRRHRAAGRALRHADRRRVGQGDVGRAVHGRAQGAHPVAEPDPPVAPRPADQREHGSSRCTSTAAVSSR